jgi:DHA1 family bicyclomycin/chloramphenicol resistance-like MFS transporter
VRTFKKDHQGISTVLAFALIPLSGFATDIYIPSLPAMAHSLRVNPANVQLTLVIFMVSSGLAQLFVGSLLDSFGRYRLGLVSLTIFTFASFCIACTDSITLIYAMRAVQGITVALIVVGKRAYFIDLYSGDKLKSYTSLFSIVWAASPIIAPFLGGYLESWFGWRSNFYFLGIITSVMLLLELFYGGESLQSRNPFRVKNILGIYTETVTSVDFMLGLLMISISYAMLVVYGMVSPFIIEHVFHGQPVITGYCSLVSGLSLMTGGIISRSLIKKPLNRKLLTGICIQLFLAALMLASSFAYSSLLTMLLFTAIIHMMSGFLFNNLFAYCLGRFQSHGGIVSGITGGGLFILTSIISYGTVNLVTIKNETWLGGTFLLFASIWLVIFLCFIMASKKQTV